MISDAQLSTARALIEKAGDIVQLPIPPGDVTQAKLFEHGRIGRHLVLVEATYARLCQFGHQITFPT